MGVCYSDMTIFPDLSSDEGECIPGDVSLLQEDPQVVQGTLPV